MSCKVCEGKLPIKEQWNEGNSNICWMDNGELLISMNLTPEYSKWIHETVGELSICKEINYCPCCGEQLDDGLVTNWG